MGEKLIDVLNSKKSEIDSLTKDIDKADGYYDDKVWKDDVLNVDIVSDDFLQNISSENIEVFNGTKMIVAQKVNKITKKGLKEEDVKNSDTENRRLLDTESNV